MKFPRPPHDPHKADMHHAENYPSPVISWEKTVIRIIALPFIAAWPLLFTLKVVGWLAEGEWIELPISEFIGKYDGGREWVGITRIIDYLYSIDLLTIAAVPCLVGWFFAFSVSDHWQGRE